MQHINFYFDEFKPKPLSFDSRFAGLVFIVVLIGVTAFGFTQQRQAENLAALKIQKQQDLTVTQTQLLELQKRLSQSTDIMSIDDKLAKQQQTLNSYRKILAQVGDLETQQFNFSEVLQQLAKHPSDTVWLTHISLDRTQLSLKGSSQDTAAIPTYIQQMNSLSALVREFDSLEVLRDEENVGLINFNLTNGRLVNAK
ncbi:PilN domain-containing protein [Aliikangiella sp. IMCC44653]